MAITYPLSIASFQGLNKFKTVLFRPSYGQESSGMASGQLRVKDLRPPLWAVDVTTIPMLIDAASSSANDFQAILESLEGGVNSFYMYNPYRKTPKNGAFTDGTLAINSVDSGGLAISLKNLPASYVLNRGDMLSFNLTGGARALHKILETVTANGSGVSPIFAISGGWRVGTAVNAVCTMNPAYGEFRMSGNWQPDNGDGYTCSFSFSAIQV